ncbi:hypothetical protein [uncultured Arthrobacter sp.]|uniref:hypothetical protein n=1 Tax=uncultured Arthrobacter sp. TaxID=114050 RepID=UPI002608BFBF|nr:hypothetical protein [uncultured Arthrobacter sp.]
MTETKLQALKQKLAAVNDRIDCHALNAPSFKEARDVVAQHPDASREEVDETLSARGLPSTAQQSKSLFLGLTSLARLNRKRIGLEGRIARLESPVHE